MEINESDKSGRDGDVPIQDELGVACSEDTETDSRGDRTTTLEELCTELCFSLAMMARESKDAAGAQSFASTAGNVLAEILSLFLIPRAHEIEPQQKEKKFLIEYYKCSASDGETGPYYDAVVGEDEEIARALLFSRFPAPTLTAKIRIESIEEVK